MLRAYEDGDEDVRPNVITISSVIIACAFTIGDDQMHERAVRLSLAPVAEMDYSNQHHLSHATRSDWETSIGHVGTE
jgi:hypothetical protein